jgi:hypothetical protein
MKSLFEELEIETKFNRLKVDLFSRFYPFSKDEIMKYKSILNFDRYHLMQNEFIIWDIKLINSLADKIDWSAVWKIKNLSLDFKFFKKYENQIVFSSIHLSKNIKWTNNLLEDFGDKFDWSNWLITEAPLSTIDNLRRFKDKLDWSLVSERINIVFSDNVIEEFADKWDWKKLSSNKNIPITVEFIQKYIDLLDFDALSQNPKSLELIYKYPTSKKWNWEKVAANSGIVYNDESFDFVFSNFKRQNDFKIFKKQYFKKFELSSFISKVFRPINNDISYFLKNNFIDHLPWSQICIHHDTKLPIEFIENYKGKLNFKEKNFLRTHSCILTADFIINNIDLFDSEIREFYNLALKIDWLNKHTNKINWNSLSRNEKLDWNWIFIKSNLEKFNINGLSSNRGIYEKLIYNVLSKKEIFEFLDKELNENRN